MLPEQLLEPALLDHLESVGVGYAGRVLRRGRFAVKVAHRFAAARARVAEEIHILGELQADDAGIPVPRMYAVADDGHAFVRDYFNLPCLFDLLRAGGGRIDDALLTWVVATYRAVEAYRHERGVTLDFTPANLFVDARRRRVYLADLGVRIAEYQFADLDRAGLRRALRAYLPWRARLDASVTVRPMLLPPSGRFHVDVEVGRNRDTALLWKNRRLTGDLGFDDRALVRLGSFGSDVPRRPHRLPATLYEDSPRDLVTPAKGDGRAVYVGQIDGGVYGRRELMLKGCGPTPLAWIGNPFHEDGYVSFPRTLWEASVADELWRLGFCTPQVVAIFSTGRVTLDNTQREWPAAAALRISDTHYRLAHLKRWDTDPEALRAICRAIGRVILGPDFSPERKSHVRAFALNFARNLGYDVGRTDALNINCFNPTPGNVRADGHFLDYSTVRFLRYHLPHFRHPDPKWVAGKHESYWRRSCRLLVGVFVRGDLLDGATGERLQGQLHAAYHRRYIDGYLAGLFAFLGLSVGAPSSDSLGLTRARVLVESSILLRRLRAAGEIELPYWQQTVPAPWFDLEGRAPAFVDAWRRGTVDPWRALGSQWAAGNTPASRGAARKWHALLDAALTHRQVEALRPRRWQQIFRPFIEAERLAALCYGESRPRSFGKWRRAIGGR